MDIPVLGVMKNIVLLYGKPSGIAIVKNELSFLQKDGIMKTIF